MNFKQMNESFSKWAGENSGVGSLAIAGIALGLGLAFIAVTYLGATYVAPLIAAGIDGAL